VIAGDELRNKLGNSLGDTLSGELGVSASAFGAGASRPIIRGMEGPRVMILQNGMGVSDVSTVSNDHAVATEAATARQIEILRGPAALLYGSGAIGGLVNVVNDRIPTELVGKPTGTVEGRYGTVDGEKNSPSRWIPRPARSACTWTATIAIPTTTRSPATRARVMQQQRRAPAQFLHPRDQPGPGGIPTSPTGVHRPVGGDAGRSLRHPTDEMSFIDLHQNRYDLDTVVNNPFAGIEKFRFRMGYTDYTHIEKQQDGTPNTVFSNRAQTRWELTHAPLAGWHGTFGVQTEQSNYSALSADPAPPS
jgi:iron complex outermembrane receptor protein